MNDTNNKAPESAEKRPQQQSDCAIPQNTSQNQGEKGRKPQITQTDPEHIIQPYPSGSQQEQKIAADSVAGTQRPQESVPQTHNRTQNTADGKPSGSNSRIRHPSHRRQPLKRGSS